jgi:hypothetical protein
MTWLLERVCVSVWSAVGGGDRLVNYETSRYPMAFGCYANAQSETDYAAEV